MKALFPRSLGKKTVFVGVSLAALALAAPRAIAAELVINFDCGIQGRTQPPGAGKEKLNFGVCEPLIGNRTERSDDPIARLFIRDTGSNQVSLSFETSGFYYDKPKDQNKDRLTRLLLNVKDDFSPQSLSWSGASLAGGSPSLLRDKISIQGSYGAGAQGKGSPEDAFDLSLDFAGKGLEIDPDQEVLLGYLSAVGLSSSTFDALTAKGYPPLRAAYDIQSGVKVQQLKSDPSEFDSEGNLLYDKGVRTVSLTQAGAADFKEVPLESDLAGVLSIGGLAYMTYRRTRRQAQATLQLD